jgi:hypothetical protein
MTVPVRFVDDDDSAGWSGAISMVSRAEMKATGSPRSLSVSAVTTPGESAWAAILSGEFLSASEIRLAVVKSGLSRWMRTTPSLPMIVDGIARSSNTPAVMRPAV